MIEEQAIVTRRHGRRAEIQMQRQSACSHCELSRGCGTGAIGRMLGYRSKPLVIETSLKLNAGDQILLGMPDRSFLKASLLIYGLPLLGLVIAALLGEIFFASEELVKSAIAVSGFLIALYASAILAKRGFSDQFKPQILQVNSEPV